VCRKYYVHPGVLQAYLLGLTVNLPSAAVPRQYRRAHPPAALRRDEVAVLQFLQEELPDALGI
jgi:DNA topoisomerase IB